MSDGEQKWMREWFGAGSDRDSQNEEKGIVFKGRDRGGLSVVWSIGF